MIVLLFAVDWYSTTEAAPLSFVNFHLKKQRLSSIFFSQAKEKYDSEMMKLKDLYAKRNEEKKKELLKAVENSTKTYEEIMVFICSEDEIN